MKSNDGRIRNNKDIFQDPNYKRHDALGLNYRMPEVAAALGLAQTERMESATRIVSSCLARIGVLHFIGVSRGAVRVLSDYSPRVIRRSVEKAVGAAVVGGRRMVTDIEIEKVLGITAQPAATVRAAPKMH